MYKTDGQVIDLYKIIRQWNIHFELFKTANMKTENAQQKTSLPQRMINTKFQQSDTRNMRWINFNKKAVIFCI